MAQFPAGGVFKGFTANSCLHSQSLFQNYRLESLKLSNVGQGHQNKPLEPLLSGIMKEIMRSFYIYIYIYKYYERKKGRNYISHLYIYIYIYIYI